MVKPPSPEQIAALDQFHHQYGTTLHAWGRVEQIFCIWFQRITGMPPKMGRRVFYSSRNWQGRSEMLISAMSAKQMAPDVACILRTALKRARSYYGFRNSLAHGDPIFDPRPGAAPNSIIIVEGRDPSDEISSAITIEDLQRANLNFNNLHGCVERLLEVPAGTLPTLLETLHQQVLLLPNMPNEEAPSTPKQHKQPRPQR